MKRVTFHLDFISPYAYLAFLQLPEALAGISYCVEYKPVLFAAMLKHHGQLGPAEIAPKRDWTYRQVLWLADKLGVPMRMPISHPFNPLQFLRLSLACRAHVGETNRYVCELIFKHVWTSGTDMNDSACFETLLALLKPQHDVQGSDVKTRLKVNTEAAIGAGVFGVPAFEVDDKIFWGLDALPMLRDYLLSAPWFGTADWNGVRHVAAGVVRNQREQ